MEVRSVLTVAEVGNKISKERYDPEVEALRVALIAAQQRLRGATFPVIIELTGDDRQGVRAVANILSEWMDQRFMRTHLFPPPSEEEKERPVFWRFWSRLPPK